MIACAGRRSQFFIDVGGSHSSPGAPEERPVMEGIDAAHAIRSAYTVRASAPRDLTPRELDVLTAEQRRGVPAPIAPGTMASVMVRNQPRLE